MASRRASRPPNKERTCWIIGPNLPPSVASLPSAFSSTLGNERNRSVWPVGAVSKTMTSNSIDLTCLYERERS